jgi:hypothetical protein
MGSKNKYCPLMEEKIDDGTCFDIHMVLEGMAPERIIPPKVLKCKEKNKICLECKHHRED